MRLYSRPDLPQGCMVVSSAAGVSAENDGLRVWLAQHRLQRTQQIVERLRQAVESGELPADIDADSLGTISPSSCTACRFRRVTASPKRGYWRR